MKEFTEMPANHLNIIYLGNKQSEFGGVPSYLEFIVPYFRTFSTVYTASGKSNQFLRLFDWILLILAKGKRVNWILIDVYSSKQFYGVVLLAFVLKVLRLKYTCILRGGDLPRRLKNNPKLSKFVFEGADNIISPSDYLKERFAQYGYESIVIPNAVDSPLFIDEISSSSFASPRLLYVRSIKKIYNPLLAIDILKILKEKYEEVFLSMIGSKEEKLYQELLEYVDHQGLSANFEYKGVLSKEDWFSHSKDFSFYLSTTDFDNTPVSLIEAANLGLVVISTNVGGVPFLIQDKTDGVLFQKGNAKEAADKICELLEDSSKYHSIASNSLDNGKKYRIDNVLINWKKFLFKL